MAGDKTYITDGQGKQHRATRVHAVTPTDVVWSSNPNDYTVQVKINGEWHRAVLTMDAGTATFFENVNIDKGLIIGTDGKSHTALIVKPESTVTLSSIKTDEHALVSGTTTGETAVVTYEENWSDVKYQDNVNVYKVLVTGSDGKVHTALLTTSSGGSIEVVVVGPAPAPLSLPDAIANSLTYVKAYGGTEQRNIPTEYTQVEYLESDGNQYIDTGIVLKSEATITMVAQANSFDVTGGPFSFWGFMSGVNNIPRWGWSIYSGRWLPDLNTTSQVAPTADTNKHTFVNTCYYNNDVLVYDSLLDGNSVSIGTVSNPTAYTDNTLSAYLFARNNNGNVGNPLSCRIFSYEIIQDGIKVLSLVPCKRNSDSVLGMYDTVSGTFFTNQGTGTFTAGADAVPTPDAPMDIVSNNGVIKVNSQGQIYTDGTVETIEDTIGNTATAEMLLSIGDYTDVQEILSGDMTRKVGIKVLDGTEQWTAYSVPQGELFRTTIDDAVSNGKDILGVLCNTYQITATGTRTSGTLSGSATNYDFINDDYTTLDTWKAYLAAQYAAGTPVIIVYPLATETTESVAGQTLNVTSGDNVVDITQASLSGLELEAEYTKAS